MPNINAAIGGRIQPALVATTIYTVLALRGIANLSEIKSNIAWDYNYHRLDKVGVELVERVPARGVISAGHDHAGPVAQEAVLPSNGGDRAAKFRERTRVTGAVPPPPNLFDERLHRVIQIASELVTLRSNFLNRPHGYILFLARHIAPVESADTDPRGHRAQSAGGVRYCHDGVNDVLLNCLDTWPAVVPVRRGESIGGRDVNGWYRRKSGAPGRRPGSPGISVAWPSVPAYLKGYRPSGCGEYKSTASPSEILGERARARIRHDRDHVLEWLPIIGGDYASVQRYFLR